VKKPRDVKEREMSSAKSTLNDTARSNTGGSCEHSTGFKAQFGRPTGAMGRFVGHLMARKNAYMNELAARVLDVQPRDHLLEIGFGPGAAICLMARKAVEGLVAGVDPSDVMVSQARRRNRKHVRAGRVDLSRATASELPFEEGRFDKVFAINSFQHWSDQERDLQEVRRVMKKGGLLLLCLRTKQPVPSRMSAPGFSDAEILRFQEMIARAGFRAVRAERHNLSREVVCLLATR
jgi:SAM-dependent methyltransferase